MCVFVRVLPLAVEAWAGLCSLSGGGVSAPGQMMNQRLPVWRNAKDTETQVQKDIPAKQETDPKQGNRKEDRAMIG